MIKSSFIILFLSFFLSSSGQAYLYNQFSEKQKDALAVHIKNIKEYSYRNTSAKRGKIIRIENYDSAGNIQYKWEHTYRKNYREEKYTYDSIGRIIQIKRKGNWEKDWYVRQITYYPNSNQEKFVVRGGNKPDTVFYTYLENGKINYSYKGKYEFGMLIKYDTTFYTYVKGELTIASPIKNDTSFSPIWDENGCIIGYKGEEYTQKCDSACRILSFKDKFESGEYKYAGDKVVEEKFWSGTELREWNKYEYNENGFVKQEFCLNKKGKVKDVRKTVYEYYSR